MSYSAPCLFHLKIFLGNHSKLEYKKLTPPSHGYIAFCWINVPQSTTLATHISCLKIYCYYIQYDSFVWNSNYYKLIYGDSKQISGCLGIGDGEMGMWHLSKFIELYTLDRCSWFSLNCTPLKLLLTRKVKKKNKI